jgi:ribonuclease HI
MYYVYTDGACSNNGKKNATAGIGIYFGHDDPRNVSQRIEGKQTNNTAELGAILHLYTILEQDILSGKKIGIVTDSIYAIRCATTYGKKCSDKAWKIDIPNKEMVKKAYELYSVTNVEFIHVMGHTKNTDVHSLGNKEADRLATQSIL